MARRTSRRRVVHAAVALSTAGLAGCGMPGGEGEEDGNEDDGGSEEGGEDGGEEGDEENDEGGEEENGEEGEGSDARSPPVSS